MMSEKLWKMIKQYESVMKTDFDTVMFGDYTETQIIALLESCIEQKKTAEEITGRDYGLDSEY